MRSIGSFLCDRSLIAGIKRRPPLAALLNGAAFSDTALKPGDAQRVDYERRDRRRQRQDRDAARIHLDAVLREKRMDPQHCTERDETVLAEKKADFVPPPGPPLDPLALDVVEC